MICKTKTIILALALNASAVKINLMVKPDKVGKEGKDVLKAGEKGGKEVDIVEDDGLDIWEDITTFGDSGIADDFNAEKIENVEATVRKYWEKPDTDWSWKNSEGDDLGEFFNKMSENLADGSECFLDSCSVGAGYDEAGMTSLKDMFDQGGNVFAADPVRDGDADLLSGIDIENPYAPGDPPEVFNIIGENHASDYRTELNEFVETLEEEGPEEAVEYLQNDSIWENY